LYWGEGIYRDALAMAASGLGFIELFMDQHQGNRVA
jgi:hypothetical protein